jgi:predicted thioredoxin/glutaredoxin
MVHTMKAMRPVYQFDPVDPDPIFSNLQEQVKRQVQRTHSQVLHIARGLEAKYDFAWKYLSKDERIELLLLINRYMSISAANEIVEDHSKYVPYIKYLKTEYNEINYYKTECLELAKIVHLPIEFKSDDNSFIIADEHFTDEHLY